MRKLTAEELKTGLDLHEKWLLGQPGGMRIDWSGSDLRGSNLRGSNLRDSNLRDSNLSGSDLSGSDLRGSDLSGSDLRGSNLSGSDLRGSKNVPPLVLARTEIVPRVGTFSGWKRCRNNVIVELEIPLSAKRSNATGRKCRAEFALVLAVHGADVGISIHDSKTKYHAGETVTCDKWEPNRLIECGGGIHFYLTQEEAEAHI